MNLVILTDSDNPLEQFNANCQRGTWTTIKDIPFPEKMLERLAQHGLGPETIVWANPETLKKVANSEFDIYTIMRILFTGKGKRFSHSRHSEN